MELNTKRRQSEMNEIMNKAGIFKKESEAKKDDRKNI